MDIEAFRQAFPEFVDEQKYSDAMITFWSGIGQTLLNEARWGDILTQGLYLYVAHNICIAYNDVVNSENGRTPGQFSGVIAGKGVGDVSVSYDTHSITLEGAGNFNLTRYGREFWQLVNIVGMGGYQV